MNIKGPAMRIIKAMTARIIHPEVLSLINILSTFLFYKYICKKLYRAPLVYKYSGEKNMSQSEAMEVRILELQAAICKTLSSPVRLRILNLLKNGEKSVSELTQLLGLPQANVSQHLAVLRETNILTTRREETSIHYKIANPKITKACNILREALLEQLEDGQKLIQYAKDK
jgi:DNA-binding transcriptional ArsR family regulator